MNSWKVNNRVFHCISWFNQPRFYCVSLKNVLQGVVTSYSEGYLTGQTSSQETVQHIQEAEETMRSSTVFLFVCLFSKTNTHPHTPQASLPVISRSTWGHTEEVRALPVQPVLYTIRCKTFLCLVLLMLFHNCPSWVSHVLTKSRKKRGRIRAWSPNDNSTQSSSSCWLCCAPAPLWRGKLPSSSSPHAGSISQQQLLQGWFQLLCTNPVALTSSGK